MDRINPRLTMSGLASGLSKSVRLAVRNWAEQQIKTLVSLPALTGPQVTSRFPYTKGCNLPRNANWLRVLARLGTADREVNAPPSFFVPEAEPTSFRVGLLLRHYAPQEEEQPQASTDRAA